MRQHEVAGELGGLVGLGLGGEGERWLAGDGQDGEELGVGGVAADGFVGHADEVLLDHRRAQVLRMLPAEEADHLVDQLHVVHVHHGQVQRLHMLLREGPREEVQQRLPLEEILVRLALHAVQEHVPVEASGIGGGGEGHEEGGEVDEAAADGSVVAAAVAALGMGGGLLENDRGKGRVGGGCGGVGGDVGNTAGECNTAGARGERDSALNVRDGRGVLGARERERESGRMVCATVDQLEVPLGHVHQEHVGNRSKVHPRVPHHLRRGVRHRYPQPHVHPVVQHV
mmetsp:Transcript_18740/g.72291  ORF Transcript_18740/g.72291 Transcript_18740/m.72291 type:complete len:285 (+) Transcript_18740:1045-1899(+)